MRRLRYSVQIFGAQVSIQKEIDGVEPEDWPTVGVVPTYRAELTTGEDTDIKRKIIEGFNSYSREALEALLARVALEIKIHALKQFDELEKPHDLIDNFNASKQE